MKKYWSALALCLSISFANARADGVVSLDYCADQYVLALADRGNIAAVSRDAQSTYAYLAKHAAGIPQIRAEAEDIILTSPQLVVRQWGGGIGAGVLMQHLQIPMLQLGYGVDFKAVEENLLRAGEALGMRNHAVALIGEMRAKLAMVHMPQVKPRALYITPGGVTSGAGTFIHHIMHAAGVENMAARNGGEGWIPLDLEALILNPPDFIITGFFDLGADQPSHWSVARHAVLRALLAQNHVVHIPAKLLSCPAWFAADAVLGINQAVFPSAVIASQIMGLP